MKKKVFASDFDGTLYFYKEAVKLPPANVEMIRSYQAAGHLFGLCTGRQIGGLTPFIGGLVAPDFYITSSGANIVDGQFRPIFKRGVDRGVADALVRRYKDDHRMTLDVEGEICVFAPMDYPGKYHVITGVDDAPEGLIHQVSIHNETLEEAAEVAAWVNARFGDFVTAFQNVIEVDIAPKGCSKGKGVERLREWMRDTWGDVTLYGIGDSNNDLPLLEAADVSYTFPYAPQELQDSADKVVPTIVDALRDSMEQEKQEYNVMSQTLRDARTYEEQRERFIKPLDRPAFHLSARVGWMNDPNGFSYYQGKYHMFYQYHPYDSHWGPMHWGHAVSRDLLHWEYLPAALAPDVSYDHAGCFSGSAIELPDGQHLLMYTGVAREMTENGELRDVQTQNLAIGDGVNYRKYTGNPILTAADLPEGGSREHFRDPKMWREADGSFRMAAVNLAKEGGGQVLLYRSDDGYHWTYIGVLAENDGRIGVMWECPDLFKLDGKDVLLASAQDMLPKGFEYHNGNGTFYLIGTIDPETGRFVEESDHAADYGIDFYAPQTVLTPDGRRVMIGWMQNWDTCNLHTASIAWFGQMSLPRELHLRNGILYQTPLRELEEMRTNKVEHRRVTVENGEITLPGVSGRTVDMEIELEAGDFARFAVWFAKNDEYHTGVSFRPHESVLKIDRKFSGSRRAIIHQRRAKVRHEHGKLKLRLILDRYSVEVFVNDGEKVLSATLYTELDADGISFFADGKATFSVTKYDLK